MWVKEGESSRQQAISSAQRKQVGEPQEDKGLPTTEP